MLSGDFVFSVISTTVALRRLLAKQHNKTKPLPALRELFRHSFRLVTSVHTGKRQFLHFAEPVEE